MFKYLICIFIVLSFGACGVNTSSSSSVATEADNSDSTADDVVVNDTAVDFDLINPNPINDNNDSNTVDQGGDDNVVIPPNNDQDNSIFDTSNAIEDKFACLRSNDDGYTVNFLKDDSLDYLSTSDLEDGVGIASKLPYNSDIEATSIAIYYYDLKPVRAGIMRSKHEQYYRLDVDKAWTLNDETKIYVRTPLDSNGLYGCYRHDLSKTDSDGIGSAVKVYRKEI